MNMDGPPYSFIHSFDDLPELHVPSGSLSMTSNCDIDPDYPERDSQTRPTLVASGLFTKSHSPSSGLLDMTVDSSLDKMPDLQRRESLPVTDVSSSSSTSDESDDEEKPKTILSGDGKSSKLPLNVLALANENTTLRRLLESVQKERNFLQKQLMETSNSGLGTKPQRLWHARLSVLHSPLRFHDLQTNR